MNKENSIGQGLWAGASAIVPLVVTVAALVLSVAFISYRLAGERAYRERWKDYNDCGLA